MKPVTTVKDWRTISSFGSSTAFAQCASCQYESHTCTCMS